MRVMEYTELKERYPKTVKVLDIFFGTFISLLVGLYFVVVLSRTTGIFWPEVRKLSIFFQAYSN